MSMTIRFPSITGRSEAEQLLQVKSYLHQLVEQLNWALMTIEQGGISSASRASGQNSAGSGGTENAVSFNEMKALIAKSAESVSAYYERINKKLESEYVAQSDFGEYTEAAAQELEVMSTHLESDYTDIQQIQTDVEGLEHSLIEVNANIKSGLLYYDDEGAPVYGLQIGQRTEIDGAEVFDKFAQFTSDRLSFYDQNDTEVAYISDYKLYITHAEVTSKFRIGGFVDNVQSNGSVITRWVGGDG